MSYSYSSTDISFNWPEAAQIKISGGKYEAFPDFLV
jgi:hypothetical protein